jgi:ferrous iron transport protein B
VPLLLEMPPYRMPDWKSVGASVWRKCRVFLTEAGTVILGCTVVMWVLLSFPRDSQTQADFDARIERIESEQADGPAREEVVAALRNERAASALEHSFGGRIGKAVEPAIEPLGFDWKIGVGLVASFAAREVLVGTLGIVYGVGGDADETSDTLRERLRAARRRDGSVLFTPLTGISLMVFFVLAAQCMSTLAAIKRESGSWKWALFMLVYMNALAYVASLLVYQGGRLLGFV